MLYEKVLSLEYAINCDIVYVFVLATITENWMCLLPSIDCVDCALCGVCHDIVYEQWCNDCTCMGIKHDTWYNILVEWMVKCKCKCTCL